MAARPQSHWRKPKQPISPQVRRCSSALPVLLVANTRVFRVYLSGRAFDADYGRFDMEPEGFDPVFPVEDIDRRVQA